jgi:hypothetical protein
MATPPRRKTTPAGVAVTSKSRDFSRPDADPKVRTAPPDTTNGHRRREAHRRRRRSTGRRRPPPTKTTTGDWKVGSSPPPPGRLPTPPWCPTADKVRHHASGAGRWHRRGAQQPAPRAPPRLPAATAQPSAARAQMGWAGMESSCSTRGASAVGRTRASHQRHAALDAGSRDALPPDYRRGPRRRRQSRPAATARGREPRRHTVAAWALPDGSSGDGREGGDEGRGGEWPAVGEPPVSPRVRRRGGETL